MHAKVEPRAPRRILFPKLAQRAAISPERASLALHAMLISVAGHFLLSCRPSADLQLRWKWFNSFSYPQSPITHWRVLLPIPSATMVRDLEFSLYRLLRFQRKPSFRPRRSGRIRILPLNTLVRTLNPAESFRLGKFGHRFSGPSMRITAAASARSSKAVNPRALEVYGLF